MLDRGGWEEARRSDRSSIWIHGHYTVDGDVLTLFVAKAAFARRTVGKPDPNPAPENWGSWIFVFSRGHFVFTQAN